MESLLKWAANSSDDQETKTSAIITSPEGMLMCQASNTLTRGVTPSDPITTRPGKVPWIEHSERNVIYEAARRGIALSGCHMYINWFPCVECARAIVQSGIAVLHCGPVPDQHDLYKFDLAEGILSLGKVEIRSIEESFAASFCCCNEGLTIIHRND